MSSFSPFVVTQEQLEAFHTIDRRLYTILTINLCRDPSESMHVIALLIWLERVGFDELVHKALLLSHQLINQLMDELLVCLTHINYGNFDCPSRGDLCDISLLRSIAGRDVSLCFFLVNRMAVHRGVTRVMNEVCRRVLSDIMPITPGTSGPNDPSTDNSNNQQQQIIPHAVQEPFGVLNGVLADKNNNSSSNNEWQSMSLPFQQPFVPFGSGFGQMMFGPDQMVQQPIWRQESITLPDQNDGSTQP